jgi:hypothetical protein
LASVVAIDFSPAFVVRYADDTIVGFQFEDDARRFLDDLRERLAAFSLTLHPEKTRLIAFGRFAQANHRRHGRGRAETFDFLGFTHICAESRDGRFQLRRQGMCKRLRTKLAEIKEELRRRRQSAHRRSGTMAERGGGRGER